MNAFPASRAATAAFFAVAAAVAQSAPIPEPLRWFRGLDEAVPEAARTKRPILVHFNHDGDPACDEFALVFLGDEAVVSALRRFCCVVGSPDRHEPAAKGRGCSRFHGIECADHARCWSAVSSAVSKSPTPTAPQFVFLRPDRQPLFRHVRPTTKDELIAVLEKALTWYERPLQATDTPPERLEKWFADADSNREDMRRGAIAAVAGLDDPRVYPFLAKQLRPESGEVKRQEALRAMKNAKNPTHLPLVVPLLFEESGRLRRYAIFALRNFGLVEAGPPLMDCFDKDTTSRTRALVLRVAARLDKSNDRLLAAHRKALVGAQPEMRVHAIMATLDLDARPADLDQILEIAHASPSMTEQAVACYVATEIILRARTPIAAAPSPDSAKDGYVRSQARPFAKELEAAAPKLSTVFADLVAHGRDDVAAYAAECAKALDSKPSTFRESLKRFHDDPKDEIFKEN